MEPDLQVIFDGRLRLIEIDGPSRTETPADAALRLERLRAEGVILERVRWQDCQTEAGAMSTAKELVRRWGLPWRH